MKAIAGGGPLNALVRYYDRLEADRNQVVSPFGFCPQEISFCLVLEPDGTLSDIADLRESLSRERRGSDLIVPFHGERSSNIHANFLWDNTGYVFGQCTGKAAKRNANTFAAFRTLHESLMERVPTQGLEALVAFLRQWRPERASDLKGWTEIDGTNIAFKLRGSAEYLHDDAIVRRIWPEVYRERCDKAPADSLGSGQLENIVSKHEPSIKGAGGQSSGTKIVSFNDDAYTSYGKGQSFNAPVGVDDAFRYTTALNHLLDGKSRRVRIGDATVVFWTDRPEAKDAEDLLGAFFVEEVAKEESAESGKMLDRLRTFLSAARQGRLSDELTDPEAPFYVLGLSPNASRLNVRYWLTGTVAEFAERLARHATDLEMTGEKEKSPPLVIRRLLDEVVPLKKGWPDREKIPPHLAGDLARAVLSGLPYPQSMFAAVIRRIRAEGFVTSDNKSNSYRSDWLAAAHRRAAILKAYLVRNKKWEVPVALDKDHADEAYHLGRLFAALEKTQEDATDGKLNSTIKDRYFGAASATPASVFPRLMRLHQFHIEKLPTDVTEARQRRVRTKRFYETTVTEICGHVRRFPSHLPLEKQGLFHIAYYHQRQDFFTKKDGPSKETIDE